nr:uncharacterized protein LOC113392568 [Vanessa tameamea]
MKYGVYYLLFVLFLINFAQRCNCGHAKKSVEDNRDDDISDEIKEESLEIAGEAEVISNYTSTNTLGDIEALGFGLNVDVGHVRELQYVGLEARDVSGDKIKGYIDCIDTKVPTCFRDKGGPLIFNNELIGLVTTGQNECTNEIFPTYSINKRLVEALPAFTFKAWLDEKIAKNSEQAEDLLEIYPKKPITRKSSIHVMTSGAELKKSTVMSILMLLCLKLD